jgi:gas vesicle protein
VDTAGIIGSVIGGVIGALAVLGAAFKIGSWYAHVNADRSVFREFMQEIRDDMRELRSDVKSILMRLPATPVSTESPLRLTDLGEKMSAHMEAVSWAAQVAVEMAPNIQGYEDYQVDQFAQDYVAGQLPSEMETRVDRCAYEFGIEREGALAVLRVVVRDALLSAMTTPSASAT